MSNVEAVARTKGLGHMFVEFMELAFPKEQDMSYINEWANRWLTGEPVIFMDSERKAVYLKLLKKRGISE